MNQKPYSTSKEELTQNQICRQDFVDNQINWMLTQLAEGITDQHRWDIEDIDKVREVVQEILYRELCNKENLNIDRNDFDMLFYPYLKDEE